MFDERATTGQLREWTPEDATHSTSRKGAAAASAAQRWLTAGPRAMDSSEIDLRAIVAQSESSMQVPIVRSAAEGGWRPLPLSKAQLEELWQRADPVPTRHPDLYGQDRRQLVLQLDKHERDFDRSAGKSAWEEEEEETESRPRKRARESTPPEQAQQAEQSTTGPPSFDSGMFTLHATSPSQLYLQQLGATPLELQLRKEWDQWQAKPPRTETTQPQQSRQVDRKGAAATAQRWLTAGPHAADSSEVDLTAALSVSEHGLAAEILIVRSAAEGVTGWQSLPLSKAQLEELWERTDPVPTRNSDLYGQDRRQLADKYERDFDPAVNKSGWEEGEEETRFGFHGEPSSRDHRALRIQHHKH